MTLLVRPPEQQLPDDHWLGPVDQPMTAGGTAFYCSNGTCVGLVIDEDGVFLYSTIRTELPTLPVSPRQLLERLRLIWHGDDKLAALFTPIEGGLNFDRLPGDASRCAHLPFDPVETMEFACDPDGRIADYVQEHMCLLLRFDESVGDLLDDCGLSHMEAALAA